MNRLTRKNDDEPKREMKVAVPAEMLEQFKAAAEAAGHGDNVEAFLNDQLGEALDEAITTNPALLLDFLIRKIKEGKPSDDETACN